MAFHTYHLQKYAGTASRHTCPACGHNKCFTLYVDEEDNPLDPTVGKCDRDSKCAYHKTPREFFAEHPELMGKDWREEKPDWLEPALQARREMSEKKLCLIDYSYVQRSVKPFVMSTFAQFLTRLYEPGNVLKLTNLYRLGVTRAGDVIFFQIDVEGRCRTGKIMKYDATTGHRIKDEKTPGRITWCHSVLKYRHELPEDWELTQCLFGEHLLPMFPDKTVALVESEKTAVICAGAMPEFIWLATGGKSQFNQRLEVLKDRVVVAFPDVDGYSEWCKKAAALSGMNVKVSNLLQTMATEDERKAQIDIADWLIEHKLHLREEPAPELPKSFKIVAPYISPENQGELLALIQDLDLEVWDFPLRIDIPDENDQ